MGYMPPHGAPIENYDRNVRAVSADSPTGVDENVCANQDVFNNAFYEAVKQNRKQEMKEARPWSYVGVVIWMIFFIWGVTLAMQVAPGHERVEHLVFAMVFGPVYVLAYYLGAFSNGDAGDAGVVKAGFGMCGAGYQMSMRD